MLRNNMRGGAPHYFVGFQRDENAGRNFKRLSDLAHQPEGRQRSEIHVKTLQERKFFLLFADAKEGRDPRLEGQDWEVLELF